MKRLFLFFLIIFCITSASAQNPFEAYGFTPKIATLSNGKYNEFHDLDTIVEHHNWFYIHIKTLNT